MQIGRSGLAILAVSIIVYGGLLLYPLIAVVEESFRAFVSGNIGASADAPLTLDNYAELLHPSYLFFFIDTFRIGFIASVIAVVLAFPIAYMVVRRMSGLGRKLCIGFFISLMFLSVLVRVYAIELTFGAAGFMRSVSALLDIRPASRAYIELTIVLGLLHYIVPMSALTLMGTIQNTNPRLVEAAQSLGAARWKAHSKITLPLASRGILSAFLISFTLSISAFVIPMILGRGRVLFVSNMIYNRFSEMANFPSGAAIAVVMLVISLVVVYGFSRVATARWDRNP